MKRMISAALCLLLLISGIQTVSADTLPHVVDFADLISDWEQESLEETIASIRENCALDVVILTVNSLEGKSAQTYADDYYDENPYGYGDDRSGLLLLIAMDTREWYISTCGEAIYIFTDYGLEQMAENFLPDLSYGDYYGAFQRFLADIPEYHRLYELGSPIDGYAPPDAYEPEYGDEIVYLPKQEPSPAMKFLIAFAIGIIVAAGAIAIMRSSMNTAKPQKNAVNYIQSGSYRLHTRRDMYLYSRVTKTAKPQNNGSGGSSVHRSGGGSHGGRGGKF